MPLRRVLIHGAGRRGEAAWPSVNAATATFTSFPDDVSVAERVSRLEAEHAGVPLLLFAHSIGAVPAVLAAAGETLDVRGMVLVEPALYDIARGDVAIERHIAAVTEARSRAAQGDLVGFWAIQRPLMFGGPYDPGAWDQERPVAERWAAIDVPWGHGVRPEMLDGIPTLVVTGGWNAEYEAIARILRSRGAQHDVIAGHTHRPQDAPAFTALVETFAAGLDQAASPS